MLPAPWSLHGTQEVREARGVLWSHAAEAGEASWHQEAVPCAACVEAWTCPPLTVLAFPAEHVILPTLVCHWWTIMLLFPKFS